jgi:hypothetical protein
MEPGVVVLLNKFDPNAGWLWPKAAVVPKGWDAGVENRPPAADVWVLPNMLLPPNGEEFWLPKAGLLEAAPKAGDDAPNAGVVCPNNEGVVDPKVEPPNAEAELCPNGDGVDPKAGVELPAPNAGVLDPKGVDPNAGVDAAPKVGAGVLGLPKVGFAPPNKFGVELAANGLGVAAWPKPVVAVPNGLEDTVVCWDWPKIPPVAGCWGLAGFGPPAIYKSSINSHIEQNHICAYQWKIALRDSAQMNKLTLHVHLLKESLTRRPDKNSCYLPLIQAPTVLWLLLKTHPNWRADQYLYRLLGSPPIWAPLDFCFCTQA